MLGCMSGLEFGLRNLQMMWARLGFGSVSPLQVYPSQRNVMVIFWVPHLISLCQSCAPNSFFPHIY